MGRTAFGALLGGVLASVAIALGSVESTVVGLAAVLFAALAEIDHRNGRKSP